MLTPLSGKGTLVNGAAVVLIACFVSCANCLMALLHLACTVTYKLATVPVNVACSCACGVLL